MNPNAQPLVIPTAAQIFDEIVIRPIGKVFTIIIRWMKRILLLGILAGLTWAGVMMSRHDGRAYLKNQEVMIESSIKAQGHQGVMSLIETLHDIDVVWFSKTAVPATSLIVPSVVKPTPMVVNHSQPKPATHSARRHHLRPTLHK